MICYDMESSLTIIPCTGHDRLTSVSKVGETNLAFAIDFIISRCVIANDLPAKKGAHLSKRK
jgi:hypothetical protein